MQSTGRLPRIRAQIGAPSDIFKIKDPEHDRFESDHLMSKLFDKQNISKDGGNVEYNTEVKMITIKGSDK